MVGSPINLNAVDKIGVGGKDVIDGVAEGVGTAWSIKSRGWKSSAQISWPFLKHSVTQSGVTILIRFCRESEAWYFLLPDASRQATRRCVESDFSSQSNRPPRETIKDQRHFKSWLESPEVEILSPEKICFGWIRLNAEKGSIVLHCTDWVIQSGLRTGISWRSEASRSSTSSKSWPPKQWVTAVDK